MHRPAQGKANPSCVSVMQQVTATSQIQTAAQHKCYVLLSSR